MSNDSTLQERIKKLEDELLEYKKRTRYGLVWIDVPEAFDEETENKLPILTEVKDLAIRNDDGKPTHILIEGDNYHALTCLNYTHKEAIDVIYIDPPYNTGNDGFRYKDKRTLKKYPNGEEVPKNHPLRHSYWLSFMAKRLELAKNLLKETGVIFISIDDNEVAQLKLLCDGVFGEENFVANIIWQKKFSPQNDATYFSDNHDYIICYAKSKASFEIVPLLRSEKATARYKNPDNDSRGDWTSSDLTVKTYSASYDYPLITPSGKITYPPKSRCWFTSKERMQILIDDNRIWFGEEGDNTPRLKKFLSEVKEGITPLTIWLHEEVGHNQSAKQEMKTILKDAENTFDTPKPVKLIDKILRLATSNDTPSVILDFFAGSGTTAQAVMELNKEDGGNRQCILVTDNEKEICTKVCYPRVQRVIEGYAFTGNKETVLFEKSITWTDLKKHEKLLQKVEDIEQVNRVYPEYDKITKDIKDGKLKVAGVKIIDEKVEGLGNSLKYYRTAFVGNHNAKNANDTDKTDLAHQAGYLLAIAENTLEEKEKTENYQFFGQDTEGVFTAVYFKENLSAFKTFCEKIEQLNKPVSVYVFDWGNAESFESYFEYMPNVEVKPIPNPIVNIYKAIFQDSIPETEKDDEQILSTTISSNSDSRTNGNV